MRYSTIQNNNCDGSHCTKETGEVRRVETGGGSGVILCKDCFAVEMAWREYRNRELAEYAKFPILEWENVPVYDWKE
jgi:hypothetical protein